MCLLGLLLGADPAISFCCVHNRDEFFERAAAPPDLGETIVYGKDVKGGGTWLGYNKRTGTFVALTNAGRRERTPPGFISRGTLVLDLLHGKRLTIAGLQRACAPPTSADEEVERASVESTTPTEAPDLLSPAPPFATVDLGGSFAGFNLIIASIHSGPTAEDSVPPAWFLTNRPPVSVLPSGLRRHPGITIIEGATAQLPSELAVAHRIPGGSHALSNSTLNDERWAKVKWLKQNLDELFGTTGGAEGGGISALLPAAAKAEDASQPPSLEADVQVLQVLLDRLVPLVTHTASLDSRSVMPDVSWSCIPEPLERHLQDHVFIEQFGEVAYGTRAITVTAKVRGTVFFCYRAFGNDDPDLAAAKRATSSAAPSVTGPGCGGAGSTEVPAAAVEGAARPAAGFAAVIPAVAGAAAPHIPPGAVDTASVPGRALGTLTLRVGEQEWMACFDRPLGAASALAKPAGSSASCA